MTLTYLQFHLVFIVPVLVLLGAVVRRRGRSTLLTPGGRWMGIGVLVVIALVYTIPWDNYLITRGVWWYGEGRVAATVWHAPVEEYLFIALQPVVAGLWLALLRTRLAAVPTGVTRRERVLGVGAGTATTAVGVALLAREPTFYLGAIVAWAGPVLALQWGFGWPVLWALRRQVALGTLVPSVYLWVADRIAIGLGVWTISERYTTGLTLAGLPVEEALFFVVTNLFVVQGLVLLDWVVRRRRPNARRTRLPSRADLVGALPLRAGSTGGSDPNAGGRSRDFQGREGAEASVGGAGTGRRPSQDPQHSRERRTRAGNPALR